MSAGEGVKRRGEACGVSIRVSSIVSSSRSSGSAILAFFFRLTVLVKTVKESDKVSEKDERREDGDILVGKVLCSLRDASRIVSRES